MRIKVSKKPKVGNERVIIKFLVLPIIIGEEMRWCETSKIKQEFTFYNGWVNKQFID